MRFFCCGRKLQQRLSNSSQLLEFFNEIPRHSYNFVYLNLKTNYAINRIENLFLGKQTEMFSNDMKFVIHPTNTACCSHPRSSEPSSDTKTQVLNFLKESYPKNKHLPLLFGILLAQNLINNNLFFVNFEKIHIADFCSFILNRFLTREKSDPNMIKFCKYLKSRNIHLPKICIKNSIASSLLT